MSDGTGLMARPKTKTGKESAAPAEERGERETVIHMKGSPNYVDWLEAVHKKTRIPKVQIFRMAIEQWAAKEGHATPPEI